MVMGQEHDLISLKDAARRLPKANPLKVWRWVRHGLKSGERRVQLRACRIGGELFTTPGWIDEFLDAVNAADAARFADRAGGRGLCTPCPVPPDPGERAKQIAAAQERLAARRAR